MAIDPKQDRDSRSEIVPAGAQGQRNLLDQAVEHLSPEQKQALALKAVEKRLDIDEAAKRAALRHQSSTVDMDNTIRQVQDIENSTKSDYTIKADYDTASGHTSVQIKKTSNTAIIVIAIVIAVLAMILLSK
jgi:hypothetical protein